MKIVFMGGIANGKKLEVPDDAYEWIVPVFPVLGGWHEDPWERVDISRAAEFRTHRYIRSTNVLGDIAFRFTENR